MKTVLCFGDSNMWGFIPASLRERYPFPDRIPDAIQTILGAHFKVIGEALSGRMTAFDDPMNEDRNARKQLPFLLETHRPLDLIAIMLGTNDLKRYMNLRALDSALGLNALIDLVENANCGPGGRRPKIILIAPPHIVETSTPYGHIFDDAIPKSKEFAGAYKEIAAARNCAFLDAALLAQTSVRDGVHLEVEESRKLAAGLAAMILKVM